MRHPVRLLLFVLMVYACWLGMMAVHEFGHVLHAWLSGGRVSAVTLPLVGFSRTDLSHNPHPLFVAAAGAVWGSVLPIAIAVIVRRLRLRYWHILQFFAGFCLIANGAYLAAGSFDAVGDAGDLQRLGVWRWLLIAFGAVTIPLGLFLWHGLAPPIWLPSQRAGRRRNTQRRRLSLLTSRARAYNIIKRP